MHKPRHCLVWLPLSYVGRGPAESCVRIVEHFASEGLPTTLFVTRARKAISRDITLREAASGLLRHVPYRWIASAATSKLERLFIQAIDAAEPGTIAYFWPGVPAGLVSYARRKGLTCVREMINSPLAKAKPILDRAYAAAGLEPQHGISQDMADEETAELLSYDYVFSSNAEVDKALCDLGVEERRILKSSFGWTANRFASAVPKPEAEARSGFRALFVGTLNTRKGVHTLLDAWEMAKIDGELLLAGQVAPYLNGLVEQHCAGGRVRQLGQVNDVAALYASCDAFVFPTHEEGGPQVTYEAAACGLPVITTPMGAARLVRHEETGLLCPAGNAQALSQAIRRLAQDPQLRRRLAEEARRQVDLFRYAKVGRQRARLLLAAADSLRPPA